MSAEIEKKIESAPMSVDYCELIDPPCPYKGYGRCGVRDTLGKIYPKSKQIAEAKRLHRKAVENPDGYQNTCKKHSGFL